MIKLKDIINKIFCSRIIVTTINKNKLKEEHFVAYNIDVMEEKTSYKKQNEYSVDLLERYGEYEVISIVPIDNNINLALFKEDN